MANNADAIDLMNENTRLKAEIERLKDQLQRENAEHTACERIWRGGQEAAEARLAKVVEALTNTQLSDGDIIEEALAAARGEEVH